MTLTGKTGSMFRVVVAACALFAGGASAHGRHAHASQIVYRGMHMTPVHAGHYNVFHTRRFASLAAGGRVIQCVAFAKQDAGIEISGNARDWWGRAAGVYERGQRPESGSVLSFLANVRMPLGHVAVVSGIEDSRTIVIDQSHWNSRGISRDIEVKDVSDDNDWSAVRVQLGRGAGYGSIYPTHGFIYPRPDQGSMVANVTRAPMPELDPAPADLRHLRGHVRHADLEVAEAPAHEGPLDLTVPGISFDAPSRSLR